MTQYICDKLGYCTKIYLLCLSIYYHSTPMANRRTLTISSTTEIRRTRPTDCRF